uniref:Selenoprotein P N-terminal domain-containing protein n=1 Tax=Monopterus albus TaxID=43700 RepID=A0A3Q3J6L6_MONAL
MSTYYQLERSAPPGVPVYQQDHLQNDVWEALDGDKDDFLIYDRCGLLTYHIVMPYSFLHYPYVEGAIRATYHKNICNCSANSTLSSGMEISNETVSVNGTQATTLSTIQLGTDGPQEGDKAPGSHHHVHHPHHPHHHPHYHTSHSNQSQHQQDKSHKSHPHYHHHDDEHHQHR